MIPENRFSASAISGNMLNLWPHNRKISFHWGPVQLQDPSQGLLVKVWTAHAVDDSVFISSQGSHVITVFQHSTDIESIGLAFDQNGRHCVCFDDKDHNSFLYWFDPVPNSYVFMPIDGTSTVITLDDPRKFNTTGSDLILGYIRAGGIKYRQQRDRFTVEYTPVVGHLGAPVSADVLYHISMQDNLRLNFIYGNVVKVWGVSDLVRKHITQQKAPAEIVDIPFEFRQMMMFGESITSTETIVTLETGEVADPNDIIAAPATFSQTVVTQKVHGGITGVVYRIAISILTDQGCVYVMEGLLYVNNSSAETPSGG